MARANIFDTTCEAAVNTINCVGVMGGGLAKQFRLRFPEMNEAYMSACGNNKVKIGKMWEWWDAETGLWIINFPTKDDWRQPSKLEYITDGLKDLQLVIADLKVQSIAIPALGCGLGGLDWSVVEPLIVRGMQELMASPLSHPVHRVEIYTPTGGMYTL